MIDYDLTEDRGSDKVTEPVLALKIVEMVENAESDKKAVLKEALKKDDFRVTSEAVLCQNR